MRTATLITLAVLVTTSALAAEPSGCDKFKWPIERERAALAAPDRLALISGAELTTMPPLTMTIGLKPSADVALPLPSERAAAAGTFAGFISVESTLPAGVYSISMSSNAWVDVVQNNRFLKPTAFSGATDCDGIRKTVKFELAAKPFVIQISGLKDNIVTLAVLPSD